MPNMAEKIEAHYLQALGEIPAPGRGDGCNLKILGAANHGDRAGLEPDEIFRHFHINPQTGGYVNVS